jgi:hypothetical protein
VLTQSELERERYNDRQKKLRDDSWLPKALREAAVDEGRAEGLIGQIHAFEEVLRREPTPREKLERMSIEQLQSLAEQAKVDLLASR